MDEAFVLYFGDNAKRPEAVSSPSSPPTIKTGGQEWPPYIATQGRSLFSAEEFSEGIENFARKRAGFLHGGLELASKLHLIAAMHFTDNGGHLVCRQIDLVSGSGILTTERRQVI